MSRSYKGVVLKIGIIGAGLAGATAARHLVDGGLDVVVLEKSGGTGGRLSTRRSDVGAFDHGAQYLSAKAETFSVALEASVKGGAATRWSPEGQDRSRPWYRGLPGMSGLVKPMLKDIDVRQHQTAETVKFGDNHVTVETQEGYQFGFDRLLVTCPAPQAIVLLEHLDDSFAVLRRAVYAPCWTAMLCFDARYAQVPDMVRGDHEGPLGWMSREDAKRGEAAMLRVTMQAGMVWSEQNLERDKEDVAEEMASYFRRQFNIEVAPIYLSAHRWRFAAVTQSVGTPFVAGCNHHIVVAGDGCLGGRAEAAHDSGLAAAQAIIASLRD